MALPNTHLGPDKIASILNGRKNLFFDGIGGVSMNALAHISHLRGHRVSGYDRTPSDLTRKLEEMGVTVYYEESEEHLKDCDALIYTVAMPESNPEYSYAGMHNIPRISRADFLGYIMSGYTHRIGISGTHGKSTTTGMVARILSHGQYNPTVLNGAPMKETGTVDMIGSNDYFAFEACEYMDSFLDFFPSVAIVLNIELDHVDYFSSIEQIRESFTNFMNITGEDGFAVINLDDENCRLAMQGYRGHAVTFGRNNPDAMFTSANEDLSDGFAAFDVLKNGQFAAHVKLAVPGEHSLADALAAFAACDAVGIPADRIAAGLGAYEGICRRMEKVAVTKSGAAVYSDYAHHPTEIATTLAGAKKICRGKLHVVFQPHTFSRTAELFDNFTSAFADSGIDNLILCDIYPARETNIYGVSSAALSDAIASRGLTSSCAPDFASAAEMAEQLAGDGDMIIVMGAGDVIKTADILAQHAK
ncbi:MAG: UDP-N-acetylmuramate--L-alanine ligase [Clostridia bacterium]|nr:UDP-N-acetylmuramate--L-alanine ligase [Clostridia bacterium]MBQ8511664.1 UDP-N-acetylmuramate--L-alanine ligase [Clostridia bacterium]